MGYDFLITSGRVREAETPSLLRELYQFASLLELKPLPVNWLLTGVIRDESLPPEVQALLPTRSWPFRSGPVHDERIQGVLIPHPYSTWQVLWNQNRDGLLVCYAAPRPLDDLTPMFSNTPDGSFEEFFHLPPTDMQCEISECPIGLHCPWRRGDVAAACDLLTILSRHCDDFCVDDDYGIWPNKDFSKWENPLEGYREILGGEAVHPDAADEL